MPIYEYQCGECAHEFEALQKMSDQPLVDCPQCSEATLVKKVSAAAFRLSGSGWYETDFKSGNKKNLVGGGASSEKDSGSGSDTSSSTSTDKKEAKPSSTDASGSKAASTTTAKAS